MKGQTGVDRVCLDVAINAGFPTGGYSARDRAEEVGTIPDHCPMINVGVNQVSAVMGLTYGAIRASTEAKNMMDAAMREVISTAQALYIDLSEHDLVEWYSVLDTLGSSRKTLMLQDVEAGRKTEVEMLAGIVINLGKVHNIPTPVNQQLFDELKRIEEHKQTVKAIDHYVAGDSQDVGHRY